MNNIKSMVEKYQKNKISEQTKVREILQQVALLGLERNGFFEKAAFYGGTALRILYGLDRFSEDLDFTLFKPDRTFDFQPFLEGMKRELASFGFDMEVSKKEKNIETGVVSAFMKSNTIQLFLAIGEETKRINPDAKIRIKLEVDTDPPTDFRVENVLVANPTSFYVTTLRQSDLFAGKMHALLFRAWKNRVKGRDWYDLIWYLQNKIPLSLKYLESCMRQAGNLTEPLDQKKVLEMVDARIDQIQWDDAKNDVRAFIADPERLDIWSAKFFHDIIKHLDIEV